MIDTPEEPVQEQNSSYGQKISSFLTGFPSLAKHILTGEPQKPNLHTKKPVVDPLEELLREEELKKAKLQKQEDQRNQKKQKEIDRVNNPTDFIDKQQTGGGRTQETRRGGSTQTQTRSEQEE